MKKFPFIVVDDSELDCFIAEKVIEHTKANADIKTFLEAEHTLTYIRNNTDLNKETTVLLLDIVMPVMNGTAFITEFEKLPSETKDKYVVIAITSSMNKRDIARVSANALVRGILQKPLTSEALLNLLQQLNMSAAV